jgi:hypothetical protein
MLTANKKEDCFRKKKNNIYLPDKLKKAASWSFFVG